MLDLSIRSTNTYVGEYAYLDEWESIGRYDVLTQSNQVDEDDICEQTISTLVIKVETEEKDIDLIKKALTSTLSHSGCAHEHDCCGCWSSYVTSVEQKDDTWIVTQSKSRNY